MSKQEEKISSTNKMIFVNDNDIHFNDLTLHPFSTPHDAANPCGFSKYGEGYTQLVLKANKVSEYVL